MKKEEDAGQCYLGANLQSREKIATISTVLLKIKESHHYLDEVNSII